MKKISSVIILILCVAFSALNLASCAKTYTPTDLQYEMHDYNGSTTIIYSFTLNNLPTRALKFSYTVKLQDDKGNSLYEKNIDKSVTVSKDDKQITISDYMYIYDDQVANRASIKSVKVDDVKILNSMSNEENRFKPYSIAISVLASAGTIVMIVLFVVGACSKKHQQNSEQPQTDKRELDN